MEHCWLTALLDTDNSFNTLVQSSLDLVSKEVWEMFYLFFSFVKVFDIHLGTCYLPKWEMGTFKERKMFPTIFLI